jgi:hypothetical protein
MAGFIFRKNLHGTAEVPALLSMVAKDSIVFTVGDAIRLNTSGFLDLSTADEQIIGFVQTVVDKNGSPVAPDSGTTDTWTMGSANQTTTLNEIMFIPAFGDYAFSADSDTTITVADLGKYFNIKSTSDAIITSGESYTIGTLMFQCVGLDPNSDADASMGLYRVVASQMGQISQAAGAA